MRWNVGMKIGSGFALALAILLIVGGVSYQNTDKLIATAQWVDHSQLVQKNLEAVLSALKDVETSTRGYVIVGDESYLAPAQAAREEIPPLVKELRALTQDNAQQQRRLDKLEPLIASKLVGSQSNVDARKDKARGFAAAVKLVASEKGKQRMDEIRQVIGELNDEEGALLKQRTAEAEASAHMASLTVIVGTLLAVGLLVAAGTAITMNISRPLRELTVVAERITLGEIVTRLESKAQIGTRGDEVGDLARSFARMTTSLQATAAAAERIAGGDLQTLVQPQSPQDVLGNAFARMGENLREQLRGLLEGSNVLAASASEIVASTTQLVASASESAAAVSETTTTVEEVRQTAQLSSQKARLVADSAQKAAQSSQHGRKAAADVGQGMERIRAQMEAIAASMMRLSEQSQAIGQIIATVEDLAAQSNLLAVNAAIEAAKAGEQGKGFGVVAQEVKSLAEQSRQATNQVRSILGDIQKATTTAVLATEQGSKAVESGSQQSASAGEAIQALSASVGEAAQAATQIAASSQQQLAGVDQVAGAMANIHQASTQNVASANQLETAARNLNELGQSIRQMVERYRV